MQHTKEEIIDAAMALDAQSREEVADRLLRSIEAGEPEDIRAAWVREIDQRIEALDAGKVKPLEGEAALERIRAKYAK